MSVPPPPPPPPPEEAWPPPPGLPPAEEPADRRSPRILWLWLLAALIGGGILTGALALLSTNGDPQDQTAGSTGTTRQASVPTGAGGGSEGVPGEGAPAIDPSIDWRRVGAAQFEAPGDQQISDVVVFGDRLVAAGSTRGFALPGTSRPLAPGGEPVSLLGWQVSITAVDTDAAALIAAHNVDNTPAPEGVRYVMVTLDVSNLLDEGYRNVWGEVDAFLVDPDGSPLADQSWCGLLPEALRSGPFDAGATHSGTMCFAILETRVVETMYLGLAPGGTERGDTDAAVWVSDDAETWTAIADPNLAGPGTQTISHLAVVGEWVYAVGTDHSHGVDASIWRSSDGSAWGRVEAQVLGGPGDQVVTDLAVVDGSLLAAGISSVPIAPGEATGDWNEDVVDHWVERPDTRRGTLWISDEGLEWRSVDLGLAGSGLRSIEQVVSFSGRVSLIGRDIDGLLTVVSSADLSTWQIADLEARDTSRWEFATAGVAGGRLYVVGRGAISTADGIDWRQDGLQFAADVTPTANGLLAVGRYGGISLLGPVQVDDRMPALSLVTEDGTWYQVTDAELVPEGISGEMTGVTSWEDRYLAVGTASSSSGRDAAVWIGGGPQGSATAESRARVLEPPGLLPTAPPEPIADLLRFDADGWEVVHLGDDLGDAELLGGVPGLWVHDIAVDAQGRVWAATLGSGIYGSSGGVWEHFGRPAGLPSNQITALEIAADGTPWVGTIAGPAYFDGSAWVAPVLPDALPIPQVTGLAIREDAVWVATLSGVARWDGTAWSAFGTPAGLPSAVAMDLLAARGGVWVVTPAGLSYWNGERWKAFIGAEYRPPFSASAYASPLDRALFYSPAQVDPDVYSTDLVRLAPNGTNRVLMHQYSYKAMTLAPEGILYVGTELYGLYVIGHDVQNVGSIGDSTLLRIGELWTAPDGTVWMDSSPGLFQIDAPDVLTHHTQVPGLDYPLTGGEHSFSDGAVIDLAFGPDGSVWFLAREQVPEWEPTG